MTEQSVNKKYFIFLLIHGCSYISPHILQVRYTTSSFYDVLLPCLKIEVAPVPGEANQVWDGKYLLINGSYFSEFTLSAVS